jgi:hypothetical protein
MADGGWDLSWLFKQQPPQVGFTGDDPSAGAPVTPPSAPYGPPDPNAGSPGYELRKALGYDDPTKADPTAQKAAQQAGGALASAFKPPATNPSAKGPASKPAVPGSQSTLLASMGLMGPVTSQASGQGMPKPSPYASSDPRKHGSLWG